MTQMILDVSDLKPVSNMAARAYLQHAKAMIAQVDHVLGQRDDLRALLGSCPAQVMYTNHSNHALFITGLLYFGNYVVLQQILPWVYRAYHARGFAFDYFPLELNAWKAAITGCLDPALAAEILPLYDWMLNQHENLIQASQGEVLFPAAAQNPQRAVQLAELTACLLQGNRKGCLQWLQAIQAQEQIPLEVMYQELLQPAMYQIGSYWEEGKISVAQEHIASALVSRLMVLLYAEQEVPLTSKGKVLITTSPNEFHEMGAWMLSDLLELDGWDTRYLGTNTPTEEIISTLEQEQPEILAISVAMPFHLEKVAELIQRVRSQPGLPQPRVMLGGLAMAYHSQLWQKLGADGGAQSAQEAVALAAQWHVG